VDQTVQLTLQSAPFVLTALLGFIYGLWPDPAQIPNIMKKLIAVSAGIGIGILAMMCTVPSPEVNLVSVVNFVLNGFLMGTSAIGINQLAKSDSTITVAKSTLGLAQAQGAVKVETAKVEAAKVVEAVKVTEAAKEEAAKTETPKP
jgi:xanthosine utilization system XapX-like protein